MKISIFFKLLAIVSLILLANCAKTEVDPVTGKKKRFEPNVKQRVNKDSKGIIFGGEKGSSGTFDFATSNPLWRASLKVIDFMPLASASYSGGIITTDWYTGNSHNEELKVTIRFLSDELNISSINVISYKKTCKTNMNCKVSAGSAEVSQKIKEKIIQEARKISLEQAKKKK